LKRKERTTGYNAPTASKRPALSVKDHGILAAATMNREAYTNSFSQGKTVENAQNAE